ncbi:unnamed protein product [Laminaria digitata]
MISDDDDVDGDDHEEVEDATGDYAVGAATGSDAGGAEGEAEADIDPEGSSPHDDGGDDDNHDEEDDVGMTDAPNFDPEVGDDAAEGDAEDASGEEAETG